MRRVLLLICLSALITSCGHVISKEVREKANIGAGDKLAVTIWEQNGKVCCISLTKAEYLTEMDKDLLGPVIKDLL